MRGYMINFEMYNAVKCCGHWRDHWDESSPDEEHSHMFVNICHTHMSSRMKFFYLVRADGIFKF